MSARFRQAAKSALGDQALQSALANAKAGFVDKRREAIAAFPEFARVQAEAVARKNHTLAHLGFYLTRFEESVKEHGGQVHWASSTEEASQIVVGLCQQAGAKRIAKGKSMVSEEMALNEALSDAGFHVRETDLGEYIIQLADEPPSHIVAPAMHKTKAQVVSLFDAHHAPEKPPRDAATCDREDIVNEARQRLRQDFLDADVGITGANFLVADTGSTVIVTNEGNGDLSACLPKVHIVTAGIEKVIPSLDDLPNFLRLLARSATGQSMTAYTTLFSGPRRNGDADGPEQFHVVLLDNGRSDALNTPFQEALRCIRCGACMNHCAVYQKIGGHVYDAVYPGPIGQVMMPLLHSEKQKHPGLTAIDACTMNAHCEAVCPMQIPLSHLIHEHRVAKWQASSVCSPEKAGLSAWAGVAGSLPWYSAATRIGLGVMRGLNALGLHRLLRPLARLIAGRWAAGRALPRMSGRSFQHGWRSKKHTPREEDC